MLRRHFVRNATENAPRHALSYNMRCGPCVARANSLPDDRPRGVIPSPLMATKLEQFCSMTGSVAQRLGITSVVIVARDPETGETKTVASPGAMDDLKPTVAAKFGLSAGGGLGDADAETGWPS